MLWPDGAVPGNNAAVQWSQLAQLINAAIQGIRDAAGTNMPKIVIHIDRGGDWGGTQWFFDNLIQTQHVQVDIIGESYYPIYHGSLGDLANCLTNTALRYGKPVFVAESDFPWTNSVWTTNIYGFPGTTNGQAQYSIALVQTVKSLPQNLGAGIFWWGSEYQNLNGINEAGIYTASYFNNKGNLLPAVDVLGQAAAPLLLNASLAGTNVNLQWPLSGAGMNLITTTSLFPVSAWIRVTNSIQNTGTIYHASLPLDTRTNHFYRLESE
jgi:arabinogalactan endo-1,4-beta-galactosidase